MPSWVTGSNSEQSKDLALNRPRSNVPTSKQTSAQMSHPTKTDNSYGRNKAERDDREGWRIEELGKNQFHTSRAVWNILLRIYNVMMRHAGLVQSAKESHSAWSCREALSGVHMQPINWLHGTGQQRHGNRSQDSSCSGVAVFSGRVMVPALKS